ncbi:hypothetical protein A3A60_03155 [Candidatus Curtissbacteria bacterium RIFCSPLOWO2_01_FULL_42_26]|uniref:Uncharacterized protein n=1 Tax=Candidatus Curtissbacteria bacterium RIFCSPLOWO2_01_FULL_42_26 TaxID=1797729 RepID=A0A1F5I2N4_9BACT|nr:MAG: hypothetical protein A3A60_03155 [Candidatus Curtissbacteria bacterium RIFCSPLOWO2_01_FULL_42_26]
MVETERRGGESYKPPEKEHGSVLTRKVEQGIVVNHNKAFEVTVRLLRIESAKRVTIGITSRNPSKVLRAELLGREKPTPPKSGHLVLARNIDQAIVIAPYTLLETFIKVIAIEGSQVKFLCQADQEVRIDREELLKAENRPVTQNHQI